MDIDNPTWMDASELSDEAKREFKEWIKQQPTKLSMDRAADWFLINGYRGFTGGHEQLVNEALEEVAQEYEARRKMCQSLEVPGFGLPLTHMPPEDERFPVLLGVESWDWKAATLLVREVCMMKVMEELTNKPEWWLKIHDPEITKKWRKEVLEVDWAAYRPYGDFTPRMAKACIKELQLKAELYQKTGLIPIFDYSSCVIKSDNLVPKELRDTLRSAVRVLEDVPDSEKDWHPGTTHKVLDLVHPSLWPLIYGRSRVIRDKRIGVSDAISHCGTGEVIPKPLLIEVPGPGDRWDNESTVPSVSTKFQWLPCDVVLDGQSAKIDSYINNLHPVNHANLYPVIEKFIEKALPAWDVIYRWPKEFETQRLTETNVNPECEAKDICQWECQPYNRPLEDGEEGNENDQYQPGYRESERFKRDWAWFSKTHPAHLPEPVPGAEHHLKLSASDVKTEGFFNGKSRIQVIVKLANVHLTPEDPEYKYEVSEELAKFYTTEPPEAQDQGSDASSFQPAPSEGSPSNSDVSSTGNCPLSLNLSDYHSIYVDNDTTEYEGGSWHSEGMLNERICATALFYYDSENITDCHLDFRTAANREDLSINLNYGQSQHYPIEQTFAIPNVNRDTLQYIGGVLTTNSPSTGEDDTRAVFFPNLLQHKVSPFRLADPTRPGHRKILALFLVDPAIPVISTANVPPQQRDWWGCDGPIRDTLTHRLPAELTQMVLDDIVEFPIGTEEAKNIRLELMDERSVKQDKTEESISWVGWNFCEH
ncbi:unnamed protein product [Clonostachys rosea f. rosea IK726]|uniref:Uncharacterized protein n=2 Tax=Bionectria ochroleuca TaxID=29856 RepID=A0A0B7KII9_BIOOC|nr:unnamed protein product [Clonostachys rosea f. rosea IK726]